MGAVVLFAVFLLPAVVSAWPASSPSFSLPPISVDLPSITASFDIPDGNRAGTLTVQHAAGSPWVTYKRNRAIIRANLELSDGARATCKLSRGNQEIASKDCSSGTFKHKVRQEGTYKLAVDASDSNNNRIVHAKSVTVRFD